MKQNASLGRGMRASRWAAVVVVVAAGLTRLTSAAPAEATSDRPPQLVLATVSIGKDSWRLIAAEGLGKSPRDPCFGVGLRVEPGAPYSFVSTSFCPIPAFSGPVDARGRREKSVLGFIFPRNVVRVQLDLGEAGERDVQLHLVSASQTRTIHTERFRWGFVRVLGPGSLQGALGYDVAGNVVYRGGRDLGR